MRRVKQTTSLFSGILLLAFCAIFLTIKTQSAMADWLADANAASQRGDYATQINLFEQAAESGNSFAQNYLAVMYEFGGHVTRNYEAAAEWHRLAAEQNRSDSELSLGIMYELGRGLPQDYVIADMLYILSEKNNGAPLHYSDSIEMKMTREQIIESQRRAAGCVKQNYKNCGF